MGTVRTLGYGVVIAAGVFLLASVGFAALAGVGAALAGLSMTAGAALLRFTPLVATVLAALAFGRVVFS